MIEAIPVVLPPGTVADETVRLISWAVSSGQHVVKDQLLVEIETSKALLEVPAPSAGYVWCCYKAGDDVAVTAPVCFITPTLDPAGINHADIACAAGPEKGGNLHAARLTRRAAEVASELGLDLSTFPRGSLVRSRDLPVTSPPATSLPAGSPPPAARVDGLALRWQRLPKRKKAEALVLAAGQADSIPCFVSVSYPTAELRAKLIRRKAASSVSAIIVFEVARLLKKHPQFNSAHSKGWAGLYEKVNIGWALDDGQGLVVPVIRDADQKSMSEIEADISRYSAAYVRNQISARDLANATFTISDLSGAGASIFLPLISRGQSSILGVGSNTLTLAFDHQLAEGHSAARFLTELSERLGEHDRASAASEVEATGLCCSFCGCGTEELQSNRGFLLRCEFPHQGYVCNLCLLNY